MTTPGSIPVETLRAMSQRFDTLCTFTAQERVSSMGFPTRVICMPGDEVTVVKWYCHKGPTVIIVKSNSRLVRSGESCIPWSWVQEMKPPKELEQHMPFPDRTWSQIIEAEVPQ